jgi:hypothetical protein
MEPLRAELDGGLAGRNEIVTRLADILLPVRYYLKKNVETSDWGGWRRSAT